MISPLHGLKNLRPFLSYCLWHRNNNQIQYNFPRSWKLSVEPSVLGQTLMYDLLMIVSKSNSSHSQFSPLGMALSSLWTSRFLFITLLKFQISLPLFHFFSLTPLPPNTHTLNAWGVFPSNSCKQSCKCPQLETDILSLCYITKLSSVKESLIF